MPQASLTTRQLPLDALRGFIIVVMALDHANYFVAQQHPASEYWNRSLPGNLPALDFLTRFVTHLAAPGFFFLLGVGAWLYTVASRRAGDPAWLISGRLALRGGLLILLQIVIENRSWSLILPEAVRDNYPLYFGVLYGLGGALIFCAGLIYLDSRLLAAISLGCLLFFEVFVANNPANRYELWQRLLFVPGSTADASVLYPVIPWLGVATFGLIFGRWVDNNPPLAYKRALWLGLAGLLLFLMLRLAGSFGNLQPARANTDWTGFLNLVKYPPALVFLLFTLGIDLLVLWLFSLDRSERFLPKWAHPLLIFGRSSLFFYLTHLFLYAGLGLLFTPRGTTIAEMYPWWLLGLLVLYPLCWLYGKFKHSRPRNSIWRFF